MDLNGVETSIKLNEFKNGVLQIDLRKKVSQFNLKNVF